MMSYSEMQYSYGLYIQI